MIKKKLSIALALSSAMLLSSNYSNAFDMTDAFESAASMSGGVSTTTPPGTFRTSTQRGVSFGGGSIRVPVKEISLVTVDKARFSAGCHGIDMYLGGFSVISGEELVNQLKMIAKGVPTLLYTMTLKAIAAPLMAAIGRLQDTLASITANLNNTCQAAEALIVAASGLTTGDPNALHSKLGGWQESLDSGLNSRLDRMDRWMAGASQETGGSAEASAARSSCWMMLISANLATDMAAAKDRGCGGTGSSNNTAKDTYRAVQGEPSLVLANADKYGNVTWNLLQATGLAPYEKNPDFYLDHSFSFFLMSIMGAQVKVQGSNEGDAIPHTAPMTPDQFVSLYMCGDTYSGLGDVPDDRIRTANNKWIKSWCEERLGNINADQEKLILRCKYGVPSELRADIGQACLEVELLSYKEFMAVEKNLGDGMLVKTMDILSSAANKAATGEPLSEQEKSLISAAPFPLYRVLNIAAAAPDVAADLLQANALNIAFQVTGSAIMGYLSGATAIQSGNPSEFLPTSLMSVYNEVQSNMRANLAGQVSRIDYFQKQSEAMMQNVNAINTEILNSTLSLGVGGSQFAEAMANTLSGG